MSSFTHPDIKTAIQYIDEELGFTDLKENSNIDPMIIALALIHELQDLDFFKTSKEDLIQQNREIAEALNLVNENIGKLNQDITERIATTINTYS